MGWILTCYLPQLVHPADAHGIERFRLVASEERLQFNGVHNDNHQAELETAIETEKSKLLDEWQSIVHS